MSFRFFANMNVGRKMTVVVGIFAVALVIFGVNGYRMVQTIKITGPLYQQIVFQKDLVADVSPSPASLIEAYVAVLQLERATEPDEVVSLVSRLSQLQKSYVARRDYWTQHLPQGKLKDTLLVTSSTPAGQFYKVVNSDLIPAIEAGQHDRVSTIIDNQLTPLYKQQRAAIQDVITTANAELTSLKKLSAQTERSSMHFLAIGGAIVFLLAIVLGLFLALSISTPLRKSVEFARRLAGGDLSGRLRLDRKDEVGVLVAMLNNVSVQLCSAIGSVQETAERVAASNEQIAVNARHLSDGTQNQASNLEETSASVEELTSSIEQVATHAQGQAKTAQYGSASMVRVQESIAQISKSLMEISEISAKSVENALNGAKAVENVMEGIGRIASSSEKIGGIINVIADIADQTNLLALNASIEAARAGEHGRGFAVVADEVSKLAERSSVSTKEIESLIKESVANVREGVDMAKGSQSAMEQIRGASQKVREMIEALKTAMDHQVSSVEELSQALGAVNEMSQSISASTEEQSINARQVSRAVEEVNAVTQQAAAATEEMSASTQATSELALHLMGLVIKFKLAEDSDSCIESDTELETAGTLDPEQIDKAIGAHTAWKVRLADAIHTGKSYFNPEKVRRDDECAFGRWLATLDADALSEIKELGVIEDHAEFHLQAARILELAVHGRQGDANREMTSDGNFAKISSSLVGALITLKSRISGRRHGASTNGKSNGHLADATYLRRAPDDEVTFSTN